MREELDRRLVEKYPKIFANRFGDMKTTAMCWGFEHGDGWYNIIDQLCNNIQHHIDWNNERRASLLESNPHELTIPEEMPQVVAVQVKEKFGTLRFYYDGGDDFVDGMSRMAESLSAVTCEDCGAPGTVRGPGWYRTLCDAHEQEHQDKFKNL